MRKFNQLFDHSYKNIHIKWHRPIKLIDNRELYKDLDQDNIFLYKIVAKRGNNYKLIYIGMSEKQQIQARLYNKDHKLKQQFFKEQNNGWVLYCSVGEFIISDDDQTSFRWAKRKVSLIEKMLIITHSEFPSLQNAKCINWFSSEKAWLTIKNSGFVKDGMYKTVSYGLFSS